MHSYMYMQLSYYFCGSFDSFQLWLQEECDGHTDRDANLHVGLLSAGKTKQLKVDYTKFGHLLSLPWQNNVIHDFWYLGKGGDEGNTKLFF